MPPGIIPQVTQPRTFQQAHRVEEEMKNDQLQRNRLCSGAIALGNDDFVEDIHRQLKEKNTVGRKVTCDKS